MDNQRKEDFHKMYMKIAQLQADLSRGIRAKVGAALVTKHGVVLTGYNGPASGMDNNLERIDQETGEFVTKDCVIHAELNCIMKAAREGISVLQSTIYVTHSPCERCAAMLLQSGVEAVYYGQVYKDTNGINYLNQRIFTKLLGV